MTSDIRSVVQSATLMRFLSLAFGGRDVVIPERCDGCRYEALARIVGFSVAERIVAELGGEKISIPHVSSIFDSFESRDVEIVKLSKEGAPAADLAHRFAITQRQVRRILSGVRR